MTIAIGRMNFILLAFGFMTQIGATELTSPCSVTMSGVDYVTTNPGPEVNNATCSLVGNDQIMMSKFVAGIISCFFLTDRGRDSSFALDDEGFKQSLKDALKYFVRNREDLLNAFKEYCAIASGTMKITDAKMKISQTAEALRIIVDNQAFQGFMSKIESALTAYSNALNCHRLQYNLPTVGVRQKDFFHF